MDRALYDQPHPDNARTFSPGSGDVTLAAALEYASFALVVTDRHGTIRQVTCPVPGSSARIKQAVRGRHITDLFQDNERSFLTSLLAKLDGAAEPSMGNVPVWLRDKQDAPVFLTISLLPVLRSDHALVAWRILRDPGRDATFPTEREQAQQRIIRLLESQVEIQRGRAAQSLYALQSARTLNRTLSSALRSSRELRRHQAETLRDVIRTRNDLVEHTRSLHESVVHARLTADDSRLRLRVLADAGWALSRTLDVHEALQHLADLVVPAVADCCVVDLAERDGDVLRHAAVSCLDAEIRESMASFQECRVEDLPEHHPLRHAFLGGHSSVVHGDELPASAWGGDAVSFVDPQANSGLTAYIVAPLHSREHIYGTITLASTKPGHTFRPEDLQFAEDLALRTAQALDNAFLFQEARDAARDRERYLSVASHELRSPLAVVSGYGSLLLRYLNGPELDRERVGTILSELQYGIQRLELLTDNLLASAELKEGQRTTAWRGVDLAQLVRDLIGRIGVAMPDEDQGRIELLAGQPVFGTWNIEGIERAIGNVLSNALKYSSPGSPVRVAVEQDSDSPTAIVRVQDIGIGMTDEELDDLFVPFARGREARATALGSGLGMYICQQIIRQHDGDLDVTSRPGEGTLVTIRLPLSPDHHDPPSNP